MKTHIAVYRSESGGESKYKRFLSNRKSGKAEYYNYNKIIMLQKLSLDKFLNALEEGYIFVDFDARTGHNHGTNSDFAKIKCQSYMKP